MILKKNFLYGGEGSNYADQVFVNDSARELLKSFGDPGTWENLTETINKVKEYTNTSNEKYSEFKPKELLEPGLNLDSELDQMKKDIMNILNDINGFIEGYDEAKNGDVATSSGNYSGSSYTTEPENTNTPYIIEGSPVSGIPAPVIITDDTDTSSEIIKDVGITTSPEAETVVPDNLGQPLAQLYVEDDGTIDVFDKDGKKIDTYTKGKYEIYEYKYDENGKPIASFFEIISDQFFEHPERFIVPRIILAHISMYLYIFSLKQEMKIIRMLSEEEYILFSHSKQSLLR